MCGWNLTSKGYLSFEEGCFGNSQPEDIAKVLHKFYFAVMDELVKEDSKKYFEFFNKPESKAAQLIIAKFSERGKLLFYETIF